MKLKSQQQRHQCYHHFCFAFAFLVSLVFANPAAAQSRSTTRSISASWINNQLAHAVKQYQYFSTQIPVGVMPRSFSNDTLRTCASDNWVAGFYPGTLLYLYESTKHESMLHEAKQRVKLMEKEQYNRNMHDLGFMLYCSYGNLQRLFPNEASKKILVKGAYSLASRFNTKVGCIRSWGKPDDTTGFRVIIDNMMNLEYLFWAAKQTGDQML